MSGPLTAKACCEALKISQPVFSRILKRLEASSEHLLLRIDTQLQPLYAILRGIEGVPSEIPLYSVDTKGKASQIAILIPLAPKGFYVKSLHESIASRTYEDLPYFLEDCRPSGFLGRLIPQMIFSTLSLPPDIRLWNADHCIRYLFHYGWNLSGNLILGDSSYRASLENLDVETVKSLSRKTAYPKLAEKIMESGLPGSSAGGEQPKFLSLIDGEKQVLVKFSPAGKNPVSQRISDLLVSEHLAHETLVKFKKTASRSELIFTSNQTFLEVERFDRFRAKGRQGLLSLRALDLEWVGKMSSWTETARALMIQGRMEQTLAHEIQWLEIFGKLIANSDMHLGNLSLFMEGEKVTGLAPSYDMLPMMYAPQQGHLLDREFRVYLPTPQEMVVWMEAWKAACFFWKEVSVASRISPAFQKIATGCLKALEKAKQ